MVLFSHGSCDFHCGPTYLSIPRFSLWSFIVMDSEISVVVLYGYGFCDFH